MNEKVITKCNVAAENAQKCVCDPGFAPNFIERAYSALQTLSWINGEPLCSALLGKVWLYGPNSVRQMQNTQCEFKRFPLPFLFCVLAEIKRKKHILQKKPLFVKK